MTYAFRNGEARLINFTISNVLSACQDCFVLPITRYPIATTIAMSAARLILRSARLAPRIVRPFSTSSARFEDGKPHRNDTADKYQQIQKEKSTNPHMTNTNSTIANEMPSVGKDNAPPELITSVDDGFTPKDSVPENTERMTGGTQSGAPESGVNSDLDVGEIEGGKFRVEPLRRTGEDLSTMRARLICSSIALNL